MQQKNRNMIFNALQAECRFAALSIGGGLVSGDLRRSRRLDGLHLSDSKERHLRDSPCTS